MRILAFDTSLDACAVAVANGGSGAPVVHTADVGRAHGERLMDMVSQIMREGELEFGDLDRIAVTIGPGSFTGLRVGIAAARGFALVTGCPVVGIGCLDIHARSARDRLGAVPVVAATLAARGDVYRQFFDGQGKPRAAAGVTSMADLAAEIKGADTASGRAGSGTVIAGAAAQMVAAAAGLDSDRIAHRRATPDVAVLCRLAALATTDGAPVIPLYLRPPDAKPQSGALPRR